VGPRDAMTDSAPVDDAMAADDAMPPDDGGFVDDAAAPDDGFVDDAATADDAQDDASDAVDEALAPAGGDDALNGGCGCRATDARGWAGSGAGVLLAAVLAATRGRRRRAR
jgi:hypothetical protein